MMQEVAIGDGITVGPRRPLLIIAGPCVIESEALCVDVARELRRICRSLGLPLVFKASFDKANRTSGSSFRGPGIQKGLATLEAVKREAAVPVLTDIHLPDQAAAAARVVDVLQIPAFLCRQTDLLMAAADTGLPINVKKSQLLAPEDMRNVLDKIRARGNTRVLLCERGTFFGYGNLVVDLRSIPLMQKLGAPVIFDATHSAQRPGALGSQSGGDRDMAPVLACAAVAAGADGVFFETHPEPDKALSDAAVMLPLGSVAALLAKLKQIAAAAAGRP